MMAKQKKQRKSKYSDVRYTHPVLCPDGKYRWVLADEDFNFVYQFLCEHCPIARKG